MNMKPRRIIALAGLCLLLAVAAGTASARTGKSSASTLTVWLQADAQSANWLPIVNATNTQFESSHPGMKVDVQFQTWGAHLGKFDSTLAGGNTPDVIEMGNTEMTKYMAAGAFAPLNKSDFENSSTWLQGLADSGNYNGKTFGVPYYAGSRVVTYRSDLFAKAGVKVPNSVAAFSAGAQKLKAKFGKKGFAPVYVAGTDWYFAMSFVFDYGGGIAQLRNGKWHSLLSTPKSIAGLTAYKNFFAAASRVGLRTANEGTPPPYTVYSLNGAAAIIGPGWFSCCVGKAYTPVTKQFVMPSHTVGKPMPGFLGGSDLAVPAGSDAKSAATDWIKIYTGSAMEKKFQALGNIPNSTALADLTKINERAATRSWFVPTAKNWVNVENGNILRTMLKQILVGKLSVASAASVAGDNIETTLNQP
jgi:N,N'-diacetylchitobiose transport system substrate-binding protein